MTGEIERKAIAELWPEHLGHLAPPGNEMGQAYTDIEHGVVCNCGDVLGKPEDAPKPAEVVEHHYDAAAAHHDVVTNEVADATTEAAVPLADPIGSRPPWDAESYDGPPRPGNGEVYTDPSGTQWKSTQDQPHPDDPRFKHYAQEPETDHWFDDPEIQAAALEGLKANPVAQVYAQGYAAGRADPEPSEEEVYRGVAEDDSLTGDDPADEAQVTHNRRPVRDVALPAVTQEQIDRAGTALARGDGEGFHRALIGPPQGQLPPSQVDTVMAQDPIAEDIMIIDPTLPYGPEQVEQQLLRLDGQLERGIHAQRYWEERAHIANVAFVLAHAQATVDATGGDAASRKAQAILACRDEYLEKEVCDTMVKAIRETMHSLRSLQTGYQSILRSVGAVMQNQRGA